MVGSRALLFLFGACIASAHVLRNGKPCGHKHALLPHTELVTGPELVAEAIPAMPPMYTPGLPPFTSHFVQQGSNLFYKPQITLAPQHVQMPMAVTELRKKDCKKEHEVEKIVIREPLPTLPPQYDEIVAMKPMPIPYTPQLPSFVMPEPLPPVYVPEAPAVVEVQEYARPIHIPQAPELPPLVLPELPAPVQEIIEVPEVHEFRPIEIPRAPELPPFVMPEIPTIVYEEPPKAPCHHHEMQPIAVPEIPLPMPIQEIEILKPIAIPQAPELPPFIMPELPAVLYEEPAPLPVIAEPAPPCPPTLIPEVPVVEVYEYIKPIAIPEAPELPPFVMPELPVVLHEEPAPLPALIPAPLPAIIEPAPPCPPTYINDVPVVEVHEYVKPIAIPPAPELPPLIMPELPTPVAVPVAPVTHYVPAAPLLPEEPVKVVQYRPVPMPVPEPIYVETPYVSSDEPCEDDEPAVVVETLPTPMALPQPIHAPAHGPYPYPLATFCAENIIIDRVLPNMIINEKSYEKGVVRAGPKYPVYPTSYLAPAIY